MGFWNNWFSNKKTSNTDREIDDIIGTQSTDYVKNNPNYRTFSRVNSDIEQIVNSRSIVNQSVQNQNIRTAIPTYQTYFGNDFLAMPRATNKLERIKQYRNIASYSICNWCLDEIADDFIHFDDSNKFVNLVLPQRLNAKQQEILQHEFEKYIHFFNLREDGFNVVKRFLIEGELAWENVINPKYPDLGIVGVRFLPAEYYETLIDTLTNQPVGLVFDTEQFANDRRQMFSNSFTGSASIFNAIAPVSYSYNFSKDTSVPMLWSQLTYINSGDYSHDFLMSFPLVERVKQDYHSLALLEDAAIVLRVTHAPERLVFNVSTAKMNDHQANEYVRRFASDLKSKKVATPNGSDVVGVYNPPTMVKNFVFGKSSANDGTTVESVGSSASYDEMADIDHFTRKVLKQFKVPWSRYKTPENTMEKNDSISYEEYTFSRMIIRFQHRFAEGFKRGFITHLKLRELWDKEGYELNESDINVEFVKPVLYDLYETQKLVDTKMTIYKAFADQDEMSKIIAMKKFLGYTDKDIDANFTTLIKEKQLVAIADYFADQVSPDNPPVDFKSPIRLKNDVDATEKLNKGEMPDSTEGEGNGGEGSAEDTPDDMSAGDSAPPDDSGSDDGGDGGFGLV